MWVIFEGLDKSGKGTLEWELLKATNFKHMIIDRGPAGYATFDTLFNRSTGISLLNFRRHAQKIMESGDFMVVYCTVHKDVAAKRLEEHNETCPYDYFKAQKIYYNNIHMFYKPDKVLTLDTTDKPIDECVELIIKKLKEVQQIEL